jgi:hypothetical protein
MQTLMQACDYAARRHVGQTRDGAAREPYVNHVIEWPPAWRAARQRTRRW